MVSEKIHLSQRKNSIPSPILSMPFPPLPPTPEINTSTDISSEYPPLPSEKDLNGCTVLTIQPPPPPPEEVQQAEKNDPINTSANQARALKLRTF